MAFESDLIAFRHDGSGVFYHGSPNVNIDQFKNGVTRRTGVQADGIFFTHNPAYAARFGAGKAAEMGGRGGRVYRVHLVPRNPYIPGNQNWASRIIAESEADGYNREIEAEMIAEARADGYDSIISYHLGSTVLEIIVLDEEIIEPLDQDIGPLCEWTSPRAVDALILFQVDGLPGLDNAPDAVRLFKDRRTAAQFGPCRRVAVDTLNPVYCDQSAWPQMSPLVLAATNIDCLVDPRDGSALVMQPDRILPLRRSDMRHLRAEFRRKPMPRAAIEQGQVAMRGV